MPTPSKAAQMKGAVPEDADADWAVHEVSESEGDTSASDDEDMGEDEEEAEDCSEDDETIESESEDDTGSLLDDETKMYDEVTHPTVFKDFAKQTSLSKSKELYKLDPVFVGTVQNLEEKPPELLEYNVDYAVVHHGDMRYRGVRDDRGQVYVLDQASDRKAVDKIVGEGNKFRYGEKLSEDIMKFYNGKLEEPPAFKHLHKFKESPKDWSSAKRAKMMSSYNFPVVLCSATCKSIIQAAKNRKNRKEQQTEKPPAPSKKLEVVQPPNLSAKESSPAPKKRKVVPEVLKPSATPPVSSEPTTELSPVKLNTFTKREREIWMALSKSTKILVNALGDVTDAVLAD